MHKALSRVRKYPLVTAISLLIVLIWIYSGYSMTSSWTGTAPFIAIGVFWAVAFWIAYSRKWK